MASTGQAMDVGDAVLTFLGDTTQLDAAFQRIPAQAETAMDKAAGSIAQVGDAADGASTQLAAAGESAVAAGQEIEASGELSARAMREAKGEAGLLGEMFGIHLPRHVRSFVAELPGVGTALQAAFAATAVLFLLEALVKGSEKLSDWIANTFIFTQAMKDSDEAVKAQNKTLLDLAAQIDKDSKALDNFGKTQAQIKSDKVTELGAEIKKNEAIFAAAEKAATAYARGASETIDDKLLEKTEQMGGFLGTIANAYVRIAIGEKHVLDSITAFFTGGKTPAEEAAEAAKAGQAAQATAINTAKVIADKKLQERLAERDAAAQIASDREAEAKQEIATSEIVEEAKIKIWAADAKFSASFARDAADERLKIEQEEATKEYDLKLLTLQKERLAEEQAARAFLGAGDTVKYKQQLQQIEQTDAKIEALTAEHYAKQEKMSEQESVAEQRAIDATLAHAREEAQKSLTLAQTTAKEEMEILVANLKEQEAAVEADAKRGKISKQQELVALENLQNQETAAKIDAIHREAAAQKEALDVQEQALKLALTQITDEKEWAKTLQQVLDIEQQRDAIAKKAATDEDVAAKQGQKDLTITKEKIEEAEKSWSFWVGQMKKDLPSLGQAIRQDLQGAIDKFNKQFSTDFAQMVVTGKNFGKDMKMLGQDIGKDFISMLTEMLLKWVETQIAMKVLGISSAKATGTAQITASAAEAGANMVASWSAAPWPIDTAAPAMGAMAYGDAMAYQGLLQLATGGVVTEPTLAMFGEKGDEAVLPLSDPQAMERVSNALLSTPMMRIASAGLSNPSAIAAAANIRQGGFDDASMAKLADHIGQHLDRSGGAAGDTHIHAHVKGMVSPDNLGKVMKQMSRRVKNGQSALHASNALRVTRRSQ